MKYNYTIFWNDWDLYEQSFLDLKDKPYTRYITVKTLNLSILERRLFDFQHRHPLRDRMFKSVFGKYWFDSTYWYPRLYKKDFDNSNDIVFIFDVKWIKGEYKEYASYLKNKYPSSYFVLICFDIMSSLGMDDIEIDKIKSFFDLIISFDQKDCEKYGFIYHPLVFSQYRGVVKDMENSDVFFLGQPKNRFKEIISCLEKLWENDVTTDVHLIRVKSKEQVYKDKISYHDDVIPYQTNLQHFIHANCALELMQHGGVGYTQRMCEAIAFGKKIITNNALIHKAPFYNPNFIFQIKSAADITPEICQKIKTIEPVDYHYKEQISPLELLQFIEDRLA